MSQVKAFSEVTYNPLEKWDIDIQIISVLQSTFSRPLLPRPGVIVLNVTVNWLLCIFEDVLAADRAPTTERKRKHQSNCSTKKSWDEYLPDVNNNLHRKPTQPRSHCIFQASNSGGIRAYCKQHERGKMIPLLPAEGAQSMLNNKTTKDFKPR